MTVNANYKTILLTGVPRSGTTLCCHLLNQFTNTVALHEPMDVTGFLPEQGSIEACRGVNNFVFDTRQSIATNQRALSQQVNGVVPDNPIADSRQNGQLRELRVSLGDVTIDKPLEKNFTLVVKHNAMFTALLSDLQTQFSCYAVIRNPLSVLASWNTVNLPVNQGRIPAGEKYAPGLKALLDATEDRISRQLIILSWFFEQFDRYIVQSQIIRYEEVIATQGGSLAPLAFSDSNTIAPLKSKNSNALYDSGLVQMLHQRLIGSKGYYWNYYSKQDTEAVLASYQR